MIVVNVNLSELSLKLRREGQTGGRPAFPSLQCGTYLSHVAHGAHINSCCSNGVSGTSGINIVEKQMLRPHFQPTESASEFKPEAQLIVCVLAFGKG